VVCSVTSPQDDADGKRMLHEADFLIQATSLGLKANDPAPLPLSWFVPGMKLKIFDTIYHPTKLQKYAIELGIPCVGGKEMLIQQGAESFTLWTKLPAPLEAMRQGFDAGVPGK
jgi:shikimate dehydrogenase